jgi:hypothetical protein
MSIPTSKQIAARLDALESDVAGLRELVVCSGAAVGRVTARVAALEAPPARPDPEAAAKPKRTKKR